MNGRTPQPIQFDRVADIYDSYVNVDFDIPFWLLEAGSVSGKVLELACGTGRVSIPLLKAGVDLSCVDYAPGMLAQFRRKLENSQLSCPIYCQDMAELALPDRFDLIFIPFHSFSEILDRRKQREALMRICSHLTERGAFICTLQNPTVRTVSMDGTSHLVGEFPMQNGEMLLVRSTLIFDPGTQVASGEQLYERLSRDKRLIEQRHLNVNFYLFSESEFAGLIRDVGFEIEALYGDYDRRPFDQGTSPFMIWKLKRSATSA
ncbi:MAG: class I SAM-dependent methyltransferase [Bacteroidota bacterium]|jgi:SAM-dependent methyltransferase